MEKLDIGAAELGLLAHMMRKIEFFTPLTIGQLEKILPTVMLYAYDKGEIALISDEPRTATVVAAEEMKHIAARRRFAAAHQAAS